MQYPNISILPPLSLLNESPVQKPKTEKKKEKNPTKTTSKNAQKESKSRKGKEKVKEVAKKAKKSKKVHKKTTKKEPKDTDEIFSPYISIVLGQVHPDLHISEPGIKHLNTLLIKIYKKLAAESSKIAQSELDQICIENAVKTFVRGDLAKFGINDGNKATSKFNESSDDDKTTRAGLVVNVDVIYRLLCKAKYANSISENAAVFLAAVIEYLMVEILELSGNAARDNESDTILPNFIDLAINYDEELNELSSRSND